MGTTAANHSRPPSPAPQPPEITVDSKLRALLAAVKRKNPRQIGVWPRRQTVPSPRYRLSSKALWPVLAGRETDYLPW